MSGCWVEGKGCNQGEQGQLQLITVIIMGQRVRVSHRIGWQGKYVCWTFLTIGTSVGSYKVPHRRRITVIRKPGCGRGYLALPLPLLSNGVSRLISYSLLPPCLKPSQSPPHFMTIWTYESSLIWGSLT